MATPEQFSRRIQIIANGIVKNSNKLKRLAALAISRSIVLRTPVDTGRARSNWQAGINNPVTSEIEPIDKTGNGAIIRAGTVIGTVKPEEAIYIRNNVNYIGKLNAGSSKQAPAGFIESSIITAVHAVQGKPLIKK